MHSGRAVALLIVFGFVYAGLQSGCTKIEFTEDTSARLSFSHDTLSFDTVFTAVGSSTRSFRVINPNDKFIRISKVEIEQTSSFFRMNVDGLVGNALTDIEIPPNDSVWVFMEVTVDPDQPLSVSPFVIGSKVVFETNGNRQEVHLEAWGQNANYVPNRDAGGEQRLITCAMNEWIWDDPRPYVIYGVLAIDSCTLVLPAGTQVYIHGGFGRLPDGSRYSDGILFFLRNGKIRSEGTLEKPVVVQGDRLEDAFSDISGQWGRIHIDNLSRGNVIDHTIIKNGILGIYVDSLAELTITNSQIYNSNASSLIGYRANIVAENSLFHTSGGNTVSFILGGSYNFKYCTIANFGTPTEALRATNFVCLDDPLVCEQPAAARLSMNFVNSIITGSSRDEISLFDAVPEEEDFFRYSFSHCIVKVDELLDADNFPDFYDNCESCVDDENEAVLFSSVKENDYHLDSLSIAEQQAKALISVQFDLEGNQRDANTPDVGCYEYVN